MYTATQDNDIHFNQLHKDDNSRIKYKKTCGHCGEEVTSKDLIKGYEYDKDHYVVVTDDELEKIKTGSPDSRSSLQIIQDALPQIAHWFASQYRLSAKRICTTQMPCCDESVSSRFRYATQGVRVRFFIPPPCSMEPDPVIRTPNLRRYALEESSKRQGQNHRNAHLIA